MASVCVMENPREGAHTQSHARQPAKLIWKEEQTVDEASPMTERKFQTPEKDAATRDLIEQLSQFKMAPSPEPAHSSCQTGSGTLTILPP